MFTIIAFVLLGWVFRAVERGNETDRASYDRLDDHEARRSLLLHIRQDVKLIAFVLGAIVIMLGIVADVSWLLWLWLRSTG